MPIPYYWILILYAFSLWAALHAVLNKRDPRAAMVWVVVCGALPGLGAILYRFFGVNRIEMRARSMDFPRHPRLKREELQPAISPLDHLSGILTLKPLLPGCNLECLFNGEETYPAMIDAINRAQKTVLFCTYIFDRDDIGDQFIEALEKAVKRGVQVRVLVDGVGSLHFPPTIVSKLKKKNIPTARFLPPSLSSGGIHFNLRNHRKILTVDGKIGFTGGMNISARNMATRVDNPSRATDVHFKVTGPIVGQMEEVFCNDWLFASKEKLCPTTPAEPCDGTALCRGVAAGPHENFEKLRLIYIGALAAAKKHVRIMTPYFIPDIAFISAINTAVLKGVKVEIILPKVNDVFFLRWAAQAYMWEILKFGVNVYYQPPPFCHTKFLTMDGDFSFIGSANLDPRSLRLNFEFNVEVFDEGFAQKLESHFDAVKSKSHEVTLEEVDARPLPLRMRDAMAKLLSPYL